MQDPTKSRLRFLLLHSAICLFVSSLPEVEAQVCSSIGQLCIKTTDCCKGCCEAHTCVERPYACSTDMSSNPGGNTCHKYICPPGQICYLAELCRVEYPCPLQPRCRPVKGPGYAYGYYDTNGTTDYEYSSSWKFQFSSSNIFITTALTLGNGFFSLN